MKPINPVRYFPVDYNIIAITMKLKLLRFVPLAVLCIILAFTWINILTAAYFATIKHQLALVLVGINLILFLFSYRYTILFTGLILFLATFNMLAFFPEIVSYDFFVKFGTKQINAPTVQPMSLLFLIGYLVLNYKYLRVAFPSD